MQRTQIYLTPAQHDFLRKRSDQKKISLSEEIRNTIDFVREYSVEKRQVKHTKNFGNWMSFLVEGSKQLKEDIMAAPEDLAINSDHYLYEEPYE